MPEITEFIRAMPPAGLRRQRRLTGPVTSR
jgi:hypothetical protein